MNSGSGAKMPSISKRRAWWLAIRPFSLPASIIPVLVGTAAAAEFEFRPGLFALTLAGSMLIHAGTNLATDFFDFRHGVQPTATLGGSIRSGLISAVAIYRAAIACFIAGSVCGLVIVAYVGWPILAVGVVSVLAGYFYTAGPISYGRRGLGEITVMVLMGPLMVMAAYFVQTEAVDMRPLYASLPVGLLVANILHANNLRDIANDRDRKKVTLATLMDRPMADYMLYSLVLGAFGVGVGGDCGRGYAVECLLIWLAAAAALFALSALKETDAVALNSLVRASARLHLHFGALLALGYLVEAVS